MPTLVLLKIKDGTLDQYDKTTTEIFGSLQPKPEELPDGLLSHAVFAIEDGVKVIDVWETKDNFEAFGSKLIPALQKAGVNLPEPKFYELHNFLKK